MIKRLSGSLLVIAGLTVQCMAAQEGKKPSDPMFLISPMAGMVKNEASFGGGSRQMSLSETGPMQGVNLLYVNANVAVGNLIHASKTESSSENGFLFYAQYYLGGAAETLRPMAGMYVEYITVYSQLDGQSSYPFKSLDVNTSVLTMQPVVGFSYAGSGFRITPFAGYFNERVQSSVSSPGMAIAGQVRNGMKSSTDDILNYASLGSRLEFAALHFIRFDAKFYFRFNRSDEPMLTTRNRVDFLLTRSFGMSVKFDYFQDKYESTTFVFAGPTFVF